MWRVVLVWFCCGLARAAAPLPEADVRAWFDALVGPYVAAEQLGSVAMTYFAVGDDAAAPTTLYSMAAGSCYNLGDGQLSTTLQPLGAQYRIGSVSKLFTATAAFQLKERGLLDLDQPVQTYATSLETRFDPERQFSTRDLMCHVMPLDERSLGLEEPGNGTDESQEELLRDRWTGWPAAPATRRISYSNMGVAVEGAVIEAVARQRWDQYVTENIGRPLGLPSLRSHTQLRGNYSNVCYGPTSYTYEPFNIRAQPSGNLYADTDDVAKFLAAHARNGTDLFRSAETAAEMHSILYPGESILPGLFTGMAHQFVADVVFGTRMLHHDGGVYSFSCSSFWYPDHGDGVFIAYTPGRNAFNPPAENTPRISFTRTFRDARGTPEEVPTTLPLDTSGAVSLTRIAGQYLPTRRVHLGITAIAGILSPVTFAVSDSGDQVFVDNTTFYLVARTPALPDSQLVLQATNTVTDGSRIFVVHFDGPVDNALSVVLFIEEPTATISWEPVEFFSNSSAMFAFFAIEAIVLIGTLLVWGGWELGRQIVFCCRASRKPYTPGQDDEKQPLAGAPDIQSPTPNKTALDSCRSSTVLGMKGVAAALALAAIIAFVSLVGLEVPKDLFDTNPVFVAIALTLMFHFALVIVIEFGTMVAAILDLGQPEPAPGAKVASALSLLMLLLQALGLIALAGLNMVSFRFW